MINLWFDFPAERERIYNIAKDEGRRYAERHKNACRPIVIAEYCWAKGFEDGMDEGYGVKDASKRTVFDMWYVNPNESEFLKYRYVSKK